VVDEQDRAGEAALKPAQKIEHLPENQTRTA
jgi:hypothetical protein